MATTSTTDSTAWTTRRVRDRRLAAGGGCSAITLIPSNDRFQHDVSGERCGTVAEWRPEVRPR
jgi:hypothetical protein